MITVALIGPDGVGKTTIAKRLEAAFPIPIKYLYMGVNIEASNYMLPTTRWWEKRKLNRKRSHVVNQHGTAQSRPAQQVAITANPDKGPSAALTRSSENKMLQKPIHVFLGSGKAILKGLGLGNRILEEWYRQSITYFYTKKGYIVLFDRHFIYDYYHYDIRPQSKKSLKRKIHGFLLYHTLAEPDLTICLDAPGEVVFQRKGEFTLELMKLKRTQYLSLKDIVKNFVIVDANRDLEVVVKEVNDLVYHFYQNRLTNEKKQSR